MPPGCLIDVNGVPTTNPAVMQESPLGSLLTFAEHKGYALAAMCEILGGRFLAVKRRIRKRYKPVPMPFLTA